MSIFYLPFSDVVSGGTVDIYKTMAAMIAGATEGHRARLLAFNVGPAEDTPVDESFGVRISRIADVSGGGAGTKTAVTAANMPRTASRVSDGNITGGVNYTVEPTAYETNPCFQHAFNTRGGFSWSFDLRSAPIIDNDQLLGLLLVSYTGNTTRQWSGTMVYEEGF